MLQYNCPSLNAFIVIGKILCEAKGHSSSSLFGGVIKIPVWELRFYMRSKVCYICRLAVESPSIINIYLRLKVTITTSPVACMVTEVGVMHIYEDFTTGQSHWIKSPLNKHTFITGMVLHVS